MTSPPSNGEGFTNFSARGGGKPQESMWQTNYVQFWQEYTCSLPLLLIPPLRSKQTPTRRRKIAKQKS